MCNNDDRSDVRREKPFIPHVEYFDKCIDDIYCTWHILNYFIL